MMQKKIEREKSILIPKIVKKKKKKYIFKIMSIFKNLDLAKR